MERWTQCGATRCYRHNCFQLENDVGHNWLLPSTQSYLSFTCSLRPVNAMKRKKKLQLSLHLHQSERFFFAFAPRLQHVTFCGCKFSFMATLPELVSATCEAATRESVSGAVPTPKLNGKIIRLQPKPMHGSFIKIVDMIHNVVRTFASTQFPWPWTHCFVSRLFFSVTLELHHAGAKLSAQRSIRKAVN